MNFVLFNILLLVAGLPAAIVFSVGVLACVAPLRLIGKSPNPPKAVIYPFLAVAGAFQVYFWGFWSAFCVTMTLGFTNKPAVTWDWLYWVAAFGWCTSLIGWFAHKEQQTSASAADSEGIRRGSTLYSLVAIGAFLLFAFAPRLMEPPYGWALRLLESAETQGDACLFQESDDRGSMAICFTDVASYSFAEAAASIREGSTDEAREALPKMEEEGIDIDALCLITITSKKLNWGDLPNDTGSLFLGTPGKQMSAIGFYGTGSSPESGVFGVPVNCHVLQEILSAGSVTLAWSSKKGEYSFSFSDESILGFREALGHVVESAKSRN